MIPGGYSTSSSFGLQSIIGGVAAMATSSSSSTFGNNPGFLHYPYVTTPAVSATSGDTQVALSWTSASAGVGWTVGSYSVGQSTTSGGPYSFSNVGNVLSSTRTGLTNGTAYYFVIRVNDALGNTIATSTQVSGTPASSGGGGGGGGGGGDTDEGEDEDEDGGATVILSGRAYPGSTITVLKDAQIAVTTVAGPDAKFTVSLTNLSGGQYTFSVYGTDKNANRSAPFSFPTYVTPDTTTTIGGIFLSPTISIDKSEVKRGDTLVIFGQSAANASVTIVVNSENEIFASALSDAQGVYLYNLDTSPLEYGGHKTKSKGAVAGEISPFGQQVGFIVGTKNVLIPVLSTRCPTRGDVNGDCKVNLIDFSIVAYWYKRTLTGTFIDIEKTMLNADGKVDLVDFSIMAYYWTG